MDCILPFAITIAWSSFAGAPVPSMTRTWSRMKADVSTLTKSATSLAFWVWATVIAATRMDPSRKRKRISIHLARPTDENRHEARIVPERSFNGVTLRLLGEERNSAATLEWVNPGSSRVTSNPEVIPRQELPTNRELSNRARAQDISASTPNCFFYQPR